MVTFQDKLNDNNKLTSTWTISKIQYVQTCATCSAATVLINQPIRFSFYGIFQRIKYLYYLDRVNILYLDRRKCYFRQTTQCFNSINMQDDLFLLFVLKAHNVSKRVFTYNVYICFVGSRLFVSQQTDSLHGRPINKLGKSNIRVILFCIVWTIQKE